MKITKEEKSLYNFLGIVNAIFGKSEYRNTIVGRGNKLYFFTHGYIGMFEDKDRETLAGGNYDFGKEYYELKQTPSKLFVLDQVEIKDNDFDMSIDESIKIADHFRNCNNFRLEYEKDYKYKLAKIAEETGVWLKDDDLKYFSKSFREGEVFQSEDNIIIKSFGLAKGDIENVTTMLVFVGITHPDIEDATQQRMEVEEGPQQIEGEPMKMLDTSEIMDDDISFPEDVDEADTLDESQFDVSDDEFF